MERNEHLRAFSSNQYSKLRNSSHLYTPQSPESDDDDFSGGYHPFGRNRFSRNLDERRRKHPRRNDKYSTDRSSDKDRSSFKERNSRVHDMPKEWYKIYLDTFLDILDIVIESKLVGSRTLKNENIINCTLLEFEEKLENIEMQNFVRKFDDYKNIMKNISKFFRKLKNKNRKNKKYQEVYESINDAWQEIDSKLKKIRRKRSLSRSRSPRKNATRVLDRYNKYNNRKYRNNNINHKNGIVQNCTNSKNNFQTINECHEVKLSVFGKD